MKRGDERAEEGCGWVSDSRIISCFIWNYMRRSQNGNVMRLRSLMEETSIPPNTSKKTSVRMTAKSEQSIEWNQASKWTELKASSSRHSRHSLQLAPSLISTVFRAFSISILPKASSSGHSLQVLLLFLPTSSVCFGWSSLVPFPSLPISRLCVARLPKVWYDQSWYD